MSLSSNNLDAFFEVAKVQSFTKAAQNLHVTQSALSQRIMNLEQELQQTLFIREAKNLRLTEVGQSLLRYCQTKQDLEGDLLDSLKMEELSVGNLRIGTFSSIGRTVVLPLVSDFLKNRSQPQFELMTKEVSEIPALLQSAQADFIFTTQPIEKNNVVCKLLGHEQNVLLTSKKVKKEVFIDHEAGDLTTFEFFKKQTNAPTKIKRIYLDEIYALIDGVILGLGMAVVPLHLAKQFPQLEVVKKYKPVKVPVYFCYFEQPFYSKTHSDFIDFVSKEFARYLS